MSMLSNALAWHATAIAGAAGQAVTYRRGVTDVSVPDAVEGRTAYESQDGDRTRIRGSQTDWLIRKTRISSVFPPTVGDQIRTATEIFEVQNLVPDECYREMRSADMLRIHVMYIGTV